MMVFVFTEKKLNQGMLQGLAQCSKYQTSGEGLLHVHSDLCTWYKSAHSVVVDHKGCTIILLIVINNQYC